jgi:MFS family permease
LTTFFLPHTPSDARFLTTEEREAAVARLRLDGGHGAAATGDVGQEDFSWFWIRRALLNWNTVFLSLAAFSIITPIYSFSLFLPTIIKSLGYTSIKAQLFTVPPNLLAFFSVLLAGHFSDRYRMRGPFMLAGCVLAICGYIMLIASELPGVRYGGTFLVAAGIFPCSPLVMGNLNNPPLTTRTRH